MDTTRPRYRPEWATLIGWYFVITGSLSIVRAALDCVRLLDALQVDDGMLEFVVSLYLPVAVVSGIHVGAGILILKIPRRARISLWTIVTVSIISSAISFAAFANFKDLPGTQVAPIDYVAKIVGLIVGELPMIAALVFLYSGRRRLFFAGESSGLHCTACNHDLKGLVTVQCPECGTDY